MQPDLSSGIHTHKPIGHRAMHQPPPIALDFDHGAAQHARAQLQESLRAVAPEAGSVLPHLPQHIHQHGSKHEGDPAQMHNAAQQLLQANVWDPAQGEFSPQASAQAQPDAPAQHSASDGQSADTDPRPETASQAASQVHNSAAAPVQNPGSAERPSAAPSAEALPATAAATAPEEPSEGQEAHTHLEEHCALLSVLEGAAMCFEPSAGQPVLSSADKHAVLRVLEARAQTEAQCSTDAHVQPDGGIQQDHSLPQGDPLHQQQHNEVVDLNAASQVAESDVVELMAPAAAYNSAADTDVSAQQSNDEQAMPMPVSPPEVRYTFAARNVSRALDGHRAKTLRQ